MGMHSFGKERDIGLITSATYSPGLSAPIALGYVHRDFVEPGTRSPLDTTDRVTGTVIAVAVSHLGVNRPCKCPAHDFSVHRRLREPRRQMLDQLGIRRWEPQINQLGPATHCSCCPSIGRRSQERSGRNATRRFDPLLRAPWSAACPWPTSASSSSS